MYTYVVQWIHHLSSFSFLGLALFSLLLTGCAATQSFPQSARSGDTITLAVGSPEGMTKNNILVEYYSDADPLNPIDVTSAVSAVFKIYPDKASEAALYDDSLFSVDQLIYNSGHAGWLTVIALNLPILPEGTGSIKVTPISPDIVYASVTGSIDQIDIGLEILPGTGTPNPFLYQTVVGSGAIARSLSILEPAPQLIFNPPVGTFFNGISTLYGAMEVVVTVPWFTSGGQQVMGSDIFVLHDSKGKQDLSSQIQQLWKRDDNQFTVMFSSPVGMSFIQSRFSVVARPGSVLGAATINSIRYFDLNGNEATGLPMSDYSLRTEGI